MSQDIEMLIKISNKSKTFLAICLLILLVMPYSVQAQPDSSDNISVFFVIDDSGSMDTNDPNDLRITAVKLFLSLLDPGDGAAIITFADDSQIMAPYTTIQDYEDKVSLINSLGETKSDGYTNMKAAFEDVLETLEDDNTDNQKIIIFLTDGKPELPDGLPPGYENETLELIKKADTPVLAIGLTSGGLTSFLGKIPETAGTGSQIIPVKTANDLLDIYLDILGKLKDRTIIGEETIKAPGTANLLIEPMLSQYIDSSSFITVLPANGESVLVSPDGTEITPEDSVSSETFVDIDPNFTILTIPEPLGGDWLINIKGNGEGQARAILRSRLRVKVLEPGYISPAGEPMKIVANLIIEDPPQPPVVSIGDANFSVLIEGPNGLRESLDLLYDDGTHGDQKSGDGDFTNTYVNTDKPGTYTIIITGRKGVVPVSTKTRVEVIEFPEIVIVSPQEKQFDIRETPIDLQIKLDDTSKMEHFEGGFIAEVSVPDGSVTDVRLKKVNGSFIGAYLPEVDGDYSVNFKSEDSFFQSLPFRFERDLSFIANVIDNLIIQDVDFGLGSAVGINRFEISEAKRGVPLSVTVKSTSDQSESMQAHLEQMPGFELAEKESFPIAPNVETTLTIHLIGDEQISFGTYEGTLVFTSEDKLDLINSEQSISLDIFEPKINLNLLAYSPVSDNICFIWDSIALQLLSESNSIHDELVYLKLDGLPGVKLDHEKIEIAPGKSQYDLIIKTEDSFPPGEYSASLIIQSREGLRIQPQSPLDFRFKIDPVWITCKRPLIFSGVGLLIIAAMISVVAVKRKRSRQPALVTGTLTYWPVAAPADEIIVDLTEFNKSEISIGKSSTCTIPFLEDDGMEDLHATISAVKVEGESPIMMLIPIGPVKKGYRSIKESIKLEENSEFQIGVYIFNYSPDPES